MQNQNKLNINCHRFESYSGAWLILVCFAGLVMLSGCTSSQRFYDRSDAPDYIKNGGVSPQLLLTQVFGKPLSPLVRNMNEPSGKLQHVQGLEDHLLGILKPLDIILIRSRSSLTRLWIPSHFTHSAIWIGDINNIGIDENGINSGQIQQKERLKKKVVFEASGDSVHLSNIRKIINVDEIIILRYSALTEALARQKLSNLFELLGTPYDYNFDFEDKSKLTCMETVKELFPELNLPVRYTAGRYAIIPDDLVHLTQSNRPKIGIVEYLVSDGSGGFKKQDITGALKVIKSPFLVNQK